MQAGSTGLGTRKLKFNIIFDKDAAEGMPSTYPKKGEPLIVIHCKTYDPVVWKLWIGVERSDIPALLKLIFRWSTISGIFRVLFGGKAE